MINAAVIGCGYWGPNLIRVFAGTEGARLHTCCDKDETKLKKIKEIYPYINITKNSADIFSNPEIDAVVIAVPSILHYELAKQALLNNKHVLIEKPMTETSKQAEELIKLAKEKRKTLMVDHTFEYHPAIRKIKEIVEKKELGEIYYINANWLNLGLLQPDVNVVFDLATHVFSITNYLTGLSPLSVNAFGKFYVRNHTEEMANIRINYPPNTTAIINVSWLEPKKARALTIVGSKKMLTFDLQDNEEPIKIYDRGVDINDADNRISYRSGDMHAPRTKPAEPLSEMAKHFIECINENKTPLTDGESGLKIVKLLESTNKSLKNGGEIKL